MSEDVMFILSTLIALVLLVATLGWVAMFVSAGIWFVWLMANVFHTLGSVHKEVSDNA